MDSVSGSQLGQWFPIPLGQWNSDFVGPADLYIWTPLCPFLRPLVDSPALGILPCPWSLTRCSERTERAVRVRAPGTLAQPGASQTRGARSLRQAPSLNGGLRVCDLLFPSGSAWRPSRWGPLRGAPLPGAALTHPGRAVVSQVWNPAWFRATVMWAWVLGDRWAASRFIGTSVTDTTEEGGFLPLRHVAVLTTLFSSHSTWELH